MEQTDDVFYQPKSFVESIKEFQTGQVYRVLTQDFEGNYKTLNHEKEVPFAERVTSQITKGRNDISVSQGNPVPKIDN